MGLIGRVSWDLRPGIIFGLLLEADSRTRCQSSGRKPKVRVSLVSEQGCGVVHALSLPESAPMSIAT